jgi:hypothetical protein
MLHRMRRLAVLVAFLVLAVPASADAKRLVRYDITGGLAPASERLVVNSDGHARQTGRAETRFFKLSAKQLSGLKHDLKKARFKSLKRRYQPEFPVMDGQTQTVTYKGRSVAVSTMAKIPKRLSRVIRRLGRLMH